MNFHFKTIVSLFLAASIGSHAFASPNTNIKTRRIRTGQSATATKHAQLVEFRSGKAVAMYPEARKLLEIDEREAGMHRLESPWVGDFDRPRSLRTRFIPGEESQPGDQGSTTSLPEKD
jgi:hypothetical protein